MHDHYAEDGYDLQDINGYISTGVWLMAPGSVSGTMRRPKMLHAGVLSGVALLQMKPRLRLAILTRQYFPGRMTGKSLEVHRHEKNSAQYRPAIAAAITNYTACYCFNEENYAVSKPTRCSKLTYNTCSINWGF